MVVISTIPKMTTIVYIPSIVSIFTIPLLDNLSIPYPFHSFKDVLPSREPAGKPIDAFSQRLLMILRLVNSRWNANPAFKRVSGVRPI